VNLFPVDNPTWGETRGSSGRRTPMDRKQPIVTSGRAAEAHFFRSILWKGRESQPEALGVQARLREPLGG